MSGRKSRRKGANWERETARRLSEATGEECRRNLTETQIGNSGDVVVPPHIPLAVQCKAGAQPPIYPALAEAEAGGRAGTIPVAIIKRTHGPGRPSDEIAVLRLDDFFYLVRELVQAGVWVK